MALEKRKRSKKVEKPIITLTQLLFEHAIKYLLCDEHRNHAFLVKLSNFFDSVNTKHYEEDGDLEVFYRITRKLLDLLLNEGIRNSQILIDRLSTANKSGEEFEEVLDDIVDEFLENPLDKSTAVFIENEFVSRLNFITVVPLVENLRTTIGELDAHDYESYNDIVEKINKNSTDITKAVVSKSVVSVTLPDVTFDGSDEFMAIASQARKYLNNEKRLIKTGIKRLNRFLSGGWQPGRVYLGNAITGGGKSVFLLNTIFWACKYNDDIVCLDRTKQPAALYITQENDVEETFDRVYSYTNSRNEDGTIVEEDQLVVDLRRNKLLDSRWAMIVKYRPKNTISAMDIDNIISEVEAEGRYEVKFLAHDYIKRLKPDFSMGDIRLDLGACVDELSMLAKRRKIPIVTTNQLNREAYRTLNENNDKHKKNGKKSMDNGKKLDISMISESQLMVENADVAFGFHKEETEDGSVFFTFKKFKDRASRSNRTSAMDYFAHEFEEDNGMRLQEDFDLEHSLSLESIESRFGVLEDNEDVFEDD